MLRWASEGCFDSCICNRSLGFRSGGSHRPGYLGVNSIRSISVLAVGVIAQ